MLSRSRLLRSAVLLCLFACLLPTMVYAALSINPVALYHFDEFSNGSGAVSRADSSGNGHTLTDNGTTASGSGNPNNCASFNTANSEYFSVANHADFQPTTKMSHAFWLVHHTSGTHTVASKWNFAGTASWTWAFAGATALHFYIDGVTVQADLSFSFTLDRWYHVVVIYDGTATGNANRFKVYVDGVQDTLSFTGTGVPATLVTNTAELRIGAHEGLGRYYDGRIDEYYIFNDVLTPADVAYLFSLGKPFRQLTAFGDSITVGYGATNPWTTILNSAVDAAFLRLSNLAVNGDQALDTAEIAYGTAPQQAILFVGANDQRTGGYGSNATKRAFAVSAMEATLLWRALPTKTYAQAATASAGWSNTSVYGGTIGRNSSTSGSTLTFSSISGTVIYVGYTIQDGITGTWKVKVDGVDTATGTGAATGSTTINGQGYGPQVLRLGGLSAGSHTIVFETTNSGLSYCDWVAGLGNQATTYPTYLATVLSPNATGFASFGVNEANVVAYNTDITSIVATLRGDGLPVTLVDVHALSMSYQSDGLHPDDTGQGQLENTFLSALTAASSSGFFSIFAQ